MTTMIEIADEDVPAFRSLLAREKERLAAEEAAKPAPVGPTFIWSKELRRAATLLSLDGEDVRQLLRALDGDTDAAVGWILWRRAQGAPVLPAPRTYNTEFGTWLAARAVGENARDLVAIETDRERRAATTPGSPRALAVGRLSTILRFAAAWPNGEPPDAAKILEGFGDDEDRATRWIRRQIERGAPLLPVDPAFRRPAA